MSIVGTNHLIVPLTNKSKPFEGQNLLRIIAKKADTGTVDSKGEMVKDYHPNLKSTVCVSVPAIEDQAVIDNFPGLMVHIKELLSSAQKEIVKGLILSDAITSVNDTQIDVAQCIKHLDSQQSGDSFTTEYLQKWFDDFYSDAAYEFCTKVCKFTNFPLTEEQDKTVSNKRNGLRGIFAQFASRKFTPVEGHIKAVTNFAKFAGEEDNTMTRIIVICDKAQAEIDSLTDSFAIGD